MTISAKILADSISVLGQRITTFELEYPRYIHSELMTFRLASKNSSSSRALPIQTANNLIRNNTAMPSHWGKAQKGMQADEECVNYLERQELMLSDDGNPILNIDGTFVTYTKHISRENLWLEARDAALEYADIFKDLGYHKQIINRLTEPYSHIKVCLTATDFGNWFWLRNDKAAQPEIMYLAQAMLRELESSLPKVLATGSWHLPYYNNGIWEPKNVADAVCTNEQLIDGIIPEDVFDSHGVSLNDALMISASCCAQTSYRKTDDSLEKSKDIYNKLVGMDPPHFSPFEHQATPMDNSFNFNNVGVTHLDRYGNYWSGNFKKWIQYRQLLMNNLNIYAMTSTKTRSD